MGVLAQGFAGANVGQAIDDHAIEVGDRGKALLLFLPGLALRSGTFGFLPVDLCPWPEVSVKASGIGHMGCGFFSGDLAVEFCIDIRRVGLKE